MNFILRLFSLTTIYHEEAFPVKHLSLVLREGKDENYKSEK